MKKCFKCGQNKDISSFHRRGDGFQSVCKQCRKELDKSLYKTNKKKIKQKKKESSKEYYRWYQSLKDKPCKDCNNSFPAPCMQWDHLPNFHKSYEVSYMVRRRFSKDKVLKEIAKCELVCANCHAIRTHITRK